MMHKLVWRNLWRNSRRTSITVASIVFALLFAILMQSFQIGVFNNLIKNVVGYYSGYIQVHQKGYWDEQVLDNSFTIHDSTIQNMLKIDHVVEVVPRLESFILVSKGMVTKGCLLVGTDTKKENNLTQLQEKLIKGEYFNTRKDGFIIAQGLAQKLGVTVNDSIVLFGQGYHGVLAADKYRISGIVHLPSTEMDNSFVYIPLSSAQELLSAENKITSLSLKIDDPKKIQWIVDNIKSQLGDNYEVMSWQEMMPEIANHIKADTISFSIFIGILYLIIGFGLFGTVLMMTIERKNEFGMLLAIGMKKNQLKLILLGETIVITFIGICIGWIISYPLVIYFKKFPIYFSGELAKAYEQYGFEAIFPAELDASVFLYQTIAILSMAILVSLYPLWHISKLDPLKAMKK